jgi:1-deoxy-D-xylulose-5-phosphate synthase
VKFQSEFPERFFDVGICEQHGVAFCSGLAHQGYKPVATIYSTFLQRAFDQVFHEVSLNNYPVIFAMDRAGLVGADGATAHGLADIAYLRLWPHMILMAPRDEKELKQMLFFAKNQKVSVAIRYPRDAVPEKLPDERSDLKLGLSEKLREGHDATFFAYGSMVAIALEAAEILEKEDLHLRVINARFAKPLDEECLIRETQEQRLVFSLEEAWLDGGFGSACLEALCRHGVNTQNFRRFGIENKYIEAAGRNEQLKMVGLDAPHIAHVVSQELKACLKTT